MASRHEPNIGWIGWLKMIVHSYMVHSICISRREAVCVCVCTIFIRNSLTYSVRRVRNIDWVTRPFFFHAATITCCSTACVHRYQFAWQWHMENCLAIQRPIDNGQSNRTLCELVVRVNNVVALSIFTPPQNKIEYILFGLSSIPSMCVCVCVVVCRSSSTHTTQC